MDHAAHGAVDRSLLQCLPRTVVAVFDHDLNLVLADGGALDESAPGFLPGSRLADVVPNDRLADAIGCARQALAGMTTVFEYRDTTAGRTWSVDIGPYRPHGTGADGIVWAARDVSAERRAQEARPAAGLHDSLTKLANRELFIDRLTHALARLEGGGRSLAVMFIDLDRLKSVNDSLGHSAGDEVLVRAARRIRSAVRPTDTVARFGGDEFVVLCEGIHGAVEAERVGRRIAAALARPIFIEEVQLRLTASMGVKTVNEPVDAAAVVRDADSAMYRAKRRGRAHLEFFDETMRLATSDRLQIETGLRRALVEDRLTLLYQPQVRMGDFATVGAEALLRWVRPDGSLADPADFLAVAEDAGLMGQIGDWVMERVCRDIADWPDDLVASVNLSAHEVSDRRMVDRVLAFAEAAHVPPERIRFEISEASLFTEAERGAAALRNLRGHGFAVAIDDFGVGFSSLYHLRELPDVDLLKLDRAFVAELSEENPRNAAIVASVILLTNSLGIAALGEGIETQEQAELLRVMGCDFGQGFWFGRPQPADQLVAAVRAAR